MNEIKVTFWVFTSSGNVMMKDSKVFGNSTAAATWLIAARKDFQGSKICDKVEVVGHQLGSKNKKQINLVRRVRFLANSA